MGISHSFENDESKILNLSDNPCNSIEINVEGLITDTFYIKLQYSRKTLLKDIFIQCIQIIQHQHGITDLSIHGVHGFTSYYKTKSDVIYLSPSEWINATECASHSIKDYAKNHIMRQGLYIWMVHEHKVVSLDITCEHMNIYSKNNKAVSSPFCCPIYCKMKHKYEYNEKNLNHLRNYNHFKNKLLEKEECKHNHECAAFKRLENGGNRIEDKCHIELYRHPPRNNRSITLQKNIHTLLFNSSILENAGLSFFFLSDEPLDGDLSLIKEVISNGYKTDLFLTEEDAKNDNYSIMQIVEEKLNSKRHKILGNVLNKNEMLAIVLYTSCDCNYDLCKTQRNGDYKKWQIFDYYLYHAINKLCGAELGSYKLYSGLSEVKLDKKLVDRGYFVTYVSSSWVKDIALSFVENNGMVIQMNESVRKTFCCCDVSWISKFPDECEILIARNCDQYQTLLDYHENYFQCQILDESDGIQTISFSVKQESTLTCWP
eukprot:106345_1